MPPLRSVAVRRSRCTSVTYSGRPRRRATSGPASTRAASSTSSPAAIPARIVTSNASTGTTNTSSVGCQPQRPEPR